MHRNVKCTAVISLQCTPYASIDIGTMQSIDIFISLGKSRHSAPVSRPIFSISSTLVATPVLLTHGRAILYKLRIDLELAAGKKRVLCTCASGGDDLFSRKALSHPCKSGVLCRNAKSTCSKYHMQLLITTPRHHKLTACTSFFDMIAAKCGFSSEPQASQYHLDAGCMNKSTCDPLYH